MTSVSPSTRLPQLISGLLWVGPKYTHSFRCDSSIPHQVGRNINAMYIIINLAAVATCHSTAFDDLSALKPALSCYSDESPRIRLPVVLCVPDVLMPNTSLMLSRVEGC